MRASSRGRTAFLLLYGALLAWQIDRWCFTPHGLASTWSARADQQSVAAASSRGVSQSFTMGADGLDGVWLRPRVAAGGVRGDLIVDLLDARLGQAVRLERVVIPAAEAVRASSLRVPFRQVRASRGRDFRLDVRHVNVGDGPGLELGATRADALPGGRLFADGTEQWGDLVFATASRRATLPYWIHEVLRPWPAWVRSWAVVATGLLAFNLVLAWACALATGAFDMTSRELADARQETGSAWPWPVPRIGRLAVGVVSAMVIGGLSVAARPTGRYRSLDLIEALPEARVEAGWGTLHGAVSPGPVLFARIHRGVVAMPPASITWTIDVPREAVFRVGAGMRPDMWMREGDGIQMRVLIDHAGGRVVGADLTLFPFGVPDHRRLFQVEVPLHAWAGQQVRVTLQSTPERFGNAVNDVPVWTEPRIEWPRRPSAGVARVVEAGS